MKKWKAKLLSSFYSVAPGRLVFRIHRKVHEQGIQAWANQKVAFVHVPKTGGTSIGSAFGLEDPGHLTLRDLLSIHSSGSGASVIAIVFRDPLDRLVSSLKYAYVNQEKKGFSSIRALYEELKPGVIRPRRRPEFYLRHFFTRPFSDFIEGGEDRGVWIIDFKQLRSGFESFCIKAGLDRSSLPELNASAGRIRVEISHEFREEFLLLYRKDLAIGRALHGGSLVCYDDVLKRLTDC